MLVEEKKYELAINCREMKKVKGNEKKRRKSYVGIVCSKLH